MNPRWIALVCLVSVLILGVIEICRYLRRLGVRRAFVVEYLSKFSQFVMQDAFDAESYNWLTARVYEIQTELGSCGIASTYRPPAASYMVHDYPIIINSLPELRRDKTDQLLFGTRENYRETVALVDEALIRYIGVLNKDIQDSVGWLWNPLTWFREGVRAIFLLPFRVLQWFGILGSSTVNGLEHTGFLRVISGLVALIGFAGAVIGIIVDWNSFMAFLANLW